MLEAPANDPDGPISPAAACLGTASLGMASTFARAGFIGTGRHCSGKLRMRRAA